MGHFQPLCKPVHQPGSGWPVPGTSPTVTKDLTPSLSDRCGTHVLHATIMCSCLGALWAWSKQIGDARDRLPHTQARLAGGQGTSILLRAQVPGPAQRRLLAVPVCPGGPAGSLPQVLSATRLPVPISTVKY